MQLNVSRKIAYSELVITSLIFSTFIPYIIFNMQFDAMQLFHYLNVTMLILSPLGFASLFYFIDRWECRPIEMLSFYLGRRLTPPDDVVAAARVRTLNLPLVHAGSILVRYELITLLDCIYMGTVGHYPLRSNIMLGVYAAVGLAVFPIFSFFLTERVLYPVRQILAEKTKNIQIDETHVIRIGTRTRLVSILLATVMAPLAALGALIYRRLGIELTSLPQAPQIMSQLGLVIIAVIVVVFILTAGIGVLLATSISNPLGHLVQAIREIERGNLRARSNLISNDEIGVLSQSFDTMAQEIEKNRQELVNLNRNLEFRVLEKTQNLTKAFERLQLSNRSLAVVNRDLEQANRKLKEIDRLKSDFISVVSHELRTPITSIKAFAELLLLKPKMPPEKRDHLLNVINTESDRLTRLINDILDLTKIEAGKLTWHIEQLTLEDIIRTSVNAIHSLADNKSLNVSLQLPKGLPAFFGDRDRLVQVLTNLLSNAIKFTPQGGTISIVARRDESPRPQLVVSVSDTGVGIPEQDLELIFEKFGRSGDVLTSHTEGTGLGLSITRQIVEYHGGTIRAASTVGSGSTFTFTLPLNKTWSTLGKQTEEARL